MKMSQFKLHSEAKKKLANLAENKNTTLFIHYSCESFFDIKDGASPRITSIAVRYFGSGQTQSFSIHQAAELSGVKPTEISENYNVLEKETLERFFDFVNRHKSFLWVHWNMRDINYGFEAIKHRFSVLGGTPVSIEDSRKYDLANIFHDYFGPKYVPHSRFQNILEKNEMRPRNFMGGKEEAEAFDAGEYVKLHQSTLSKVDALMNLTQSVCAGKLKSDNSYAKMRGLKLSTLGGIIKDHPIITIVVALGAILTLVVRSLDLWGKLGLG